MLGKITSKNQITIPKKIMENIPDVKHFDIEFKKGMIMLKPVRILNVNIEQIRLKMNKLGLNEDSVAEAIQWARTKR